MDKIFQKYNTAGFTIKTIAAEGQFKPLINKIKDGIDGLVNYTSRDECVKEAEQNNETIKEHCHAEVHNMPCNAMTYDSQTC